MEGSLRERSEKGRCWGEERQKVGGRRGRRIGEGRREEMDRGGGRRRRLEVT